MKIKNCFLTVWLLFNFTLVSGQNTTPQWDNYLATYDGGKLGSTTLRMDLIKNAPFAKLPYLLITEITYNTPRKDGFPERETLKKLQDTSSKLDKIIKKKTHSVHAGSFTYNNQRLEYFYVNDYSGLAEKVNEYFTQNNAAFNYRLIITRDKDWFYYTGFLYPNEQTLDFMKNRDISTSFQGLPVLSP